MHKDIEFKNGVIISLWECISEIFKWRKYNWNTWQFINVEFENDTWTGGYEFTFVFLFCGIRFRISHETEKSKKFWKKVKKEIKQYNKNK